MKRPLNGQDIIENIKGKVLYNEPMKRHTSFCIGGPADIWIEPKDRDDLKKCIQLRRDINLPLFIIGNGTNLLVRDEGIRGIVLYMSSSSLKNINCDDNRVWVASSVSICELLNFCSKKGLGGLEFLAGIPGSVGGAVMCNAGARHYERIEKWYNIGDFIEKIKIMDYKGKIRLLSKKPRIHPTFNLEGFLGGTRKVPLTRLKEIMRGKDYERYNFLCPKKKFTFGYKSLDLTNSIILEVEFLLTKAKEKDVLNESQRFLKRKKETQGLSAPSAGCIFKNPAGSNMSAGELIDKCNLKGTSIGGAVISKKHANFIVNRGHASSGDIMALIDLVKEKVKDKFGIELSLEIKIV